MYTSSVVAAAPSVAKLTVRGVSVVDEGYRMRFKRASVLWYYGIDDEVSSPMS